MNERINRLTLLHKMKLEVTERAFHDLATAKQQFDENKQQHDQLLIYRNDYMTQLEQLGNEGAVVGRLRNRMDFIHHLDHALLQLNAHIAQLAKNSVKMEQLYKQAKAAEEAVVKLIEKENRAENILIQRKEQKESDEYAQKQWYSKHINDKTSTSGDQDF